MSRGPRPTTETEAQAALEAELERSRRSLADAITALHQADERAERMAEQLRRSQRADTLALLAAGVVHDFNNLLAVIMAEAGSASERLSHEHPARASIDQVLLAVSGASKLTKQLLSYVRRERETPTLIDLNALILETEGLLRRIVGEEVDVRLDLHAGLGGVLGHSTRFNQIIMNLALNSRDAMPSGGTLTIQTDDVWLDDIAVAALGISVGAYVMLAVRDTGHGMDEATRARLFEPLFTTKEPEKGSGLGLWVVAGLVAQQSGAITVESTPGHGAMFRMYIPRVELLSVEPPAGAEPRAAGRETLLVVEDEPLLRNTIARVLESYGYHVLEAGDGKAGLHVANAHSGRIDLLVTDVLMPRMDGPTLALKLRALRPELGVLLLSGYGADARHMPSEASRGPFLQKPFGAGDLARAVRSALDGRFQRND